MPELSQIKADAYLAARKIKATASDCHLSSVIPKPASVPLIAPDIAGVAFSLDVTQKRIVLKLKCQLRCTTEAVVLARLDFASPHRNPDGTAVGVPHFHIYRDGYGDKFAYEVPPGMLKRPNDPLHVLLDFLATYNIERNGIVAWPRQTTIRYGYDRFRHFLPRLA